MTSGSRPARVRRSALGRAQGLTRAQLTARGVAGRSDGKAGCVGGLASRSAAAGLSVACSECSRSLLRILSSHFSTSCPVTRSYSTRSSRVCAAVKLSRKHTTSMINPQESIQFCTRYLIYMVVRRLPPICLAHSLPGLLMISELSFGTRYFLTVARVLA